MFISDMPWDKYGLIVELARRIENVSPQFGKTALQKLVYLLTAIYEVQTGYEHTLYTYGPFSSELASDVETVAAMGGVQITHGTKSGYEITLGNNGDWICGKSKDFIDSISDKLDILIKDFGEFNAKDLELRSTLIFLAKSEMVTIEKLKSQLIELKPYFDEGEVYSTIEELISKGFISLQ